MWERVRWRKRVRERDRQRHNQKFRAQGLEFDPDHTVEHFLGVLSRQKIRSAFPAASTKVALYEREKRLHSHFALYAPIHTVWGA